MRKLLLLATAILLSVAAISQTALYEDDFESYTLGAYLAASNPEWWDTWSGTPGTGEDAIISDDFANSPVQSVLVDETGGATDLIFKMGNKTSGAYYVTFYMYMATGYAGYYNFQHFETPGVEWALEVYFNTDGTADVNAGGTGAATFNYTHDVWVEVMHMIDLDNDWAELWIDGMMVHEWQWSLQADGTAGTNQLGSIDFFAGAQGTDVPAFYFDDLSFEVIPSALYADDFESYTSGNYIAVQNPTWWTTWSNAPGTGEDAMIVEDQANSGTQSVLVDLTGGATDLILKLGDKASGSYEANWYMYVPTGNAAYYNFQHFETPGVEWAIEVYFNTDGTADVHAGGLNTAAFNYTHDTWFYVRHVIDIDADWAQFYVDGMMIYEWQWSLTSEGDPGANQLGGVDFFAGAQGTDVPLYYFDDVEFIQTVANVDPIISVSPDNLAVVALSGQTKTETLTIENIGAADLEYEIIPVYTMPSTKKVTATSSSSHNTRSLSYVKPAVEPDPNPSPSPFNPVTEDFMLNYDGDNADAISWGPNAPYTITNAAMFPPELTQPHVGTMITSVWIYINELGEDFSIKIFDMGNGFVPGDLLYEQAFTPMAASWNEIMLDNPVYITGAEIWVGYEYTQPILENWIPGVDAGPRDPNGDWMSFGGVVWTHLSEYESDANWNIRANLTGDPMPSWLSFDPASGVIAPDGSVDVTVTLDATELEPDTYNAHARIISNDNNNPQLDIPVLFLVGPVGTPEIPAEETNVTIQPNPATDQIFIVSDKEILEVEVVNQLGQRVYMQEVGNTTLNLNTSKFESGVYYVRTKFAQGTTTQKLVIK